MPLIHCKVELKCKKNIFTIEDTKLYALVKTLSARANQKLSKLLSKGFEKSVYQNEYKMKSGNKNATNEYRYFLESNFVLVYANQDANAKRFNA